MADETIADPIKDGLPKSAFAKASDQIRIRSDRFQQIYSNNMTLSLNTWDVAITFGELTGEREGKTVIEETVKISMTREMAKILAALLNNHIAIFEKNFWEIKLPVAEPAEATTAEGEAKD
jgi:hypothetical protein